MNTFIPRSYQEEALVALQDTRNNGINRALVVMASGLGKTLTSAFDIESYLAQYPNSKILVLCHTMGILYQTRDKFEDFFGDSYSYGMYNGLEKANTEVDFLFANLQSTSLHLDEFNESDFDYIVVDEAHHGSASTFRKAIEFFKPKFLLGMTATPDRSDDADIRDIFGEAVYEYDLLSAIRDDWLSSIDYRLELDEIDKIDSLLESKEPISMKGLNRDFFIPKRDEEIVKLIHERSSVKDNPTTAIFCQSIAHANHIAELMNVPVLHSELSDEEKFERLEGFRNGDIKTICAVDILNEGIDVPRTDVIVFLRVTQSKIVFYQQLGRGLRKAEGKNDVLVLDFVGTAERLDQIFTLEREFNEHCSGEKSKKPENDEEPKKLTVKIDTVKFTERKMDIVELIERANSFKRCTDEQLLADFRQECLRLGRMPRCREFKAHRKATYIARFGSMKNTMRLAGCEDLWEECSYTRMTEDEALDILAELFYKLGYVPGRNEIKDVPGLPGAAWYRVHFGSIANALNLRDIYPEVSQFRGHSRVWNKELIAESFRRIYSELGHTPTSTEIFSSSNSNRPSFYILEKTFGDLHTALLYSGIPVTIIPQTDNKVALAVRKELGLPEDYLELCEFVVKNHNNPGSIAHLIDPGFAVKALEHPENIRCWGLRPSTKSEILAALKRKSQELGHVPKRDEYFSDPMMATNLQVNVNFGCYTKMLVEAGLRDAPHTRGKKLSKSEMIDLVKKKAIELGRTPLLKELNDDPLMPSASYISNHFNGYNNLVIEAGLIPYSKRRSRK